ncbi:unnamed protein product [Amoebophrya sp. A120]|nr:unnamed protein product [Amoebophrya sp. A120]|eukprot:GSA120T00019256001.1
MPTMKGGGKPAPPEHEDSKEIPESLKHLVASKGALMTRKQELYKLSSRVNLSAIPYSDLYPAAKFDNRNSRVQQGDLMGGATMNANGKRQGRLPRLTIFLFGMSIAGFRVMQFSKEVYMKKFYTDDYPQANIGIMSMFMILGVLIDAFTDPWFARITDNWVSKQGRRKPFLRVAVWFTPLAFVLGFFPPNLGSSFSAFYFGFWHIVSKLADTLTMLPMEAFGNELTPHYKERDRLWGYMFMMRTIISIMGMAMVGMMKWGPDCDGSANSGCLSHGFNVLVLGLLSFSLPLYYFLQTVPERDYRLSENYLYTQNTGEMLSDETLRANFLIFVAELKETLFGSTTWIPQDQIRGTTTEKETQLRSQLKKKKFFKECCKRRVEPYEFKTNDIIPNMISSLLNAPFRLLLVAECIEAVGARFPFIVLPYVMTWLVGENNFEASSAIATVLVGMAFVAVISVPTFWKPLSNRIGKFRAFFLGAILYALVWLNMGFVLKYDAKMSSLGMQAVFMGLAQGSHFLFDSMLNDVVDYDEFLSGKRREAQYMMCKSFIPKFLELPAQFVPFVLMQNFGYDPNLNKTPDGLVQDCPNGECQPKGVLIVMRASASYVPFLFYIIAVYYLLWFPLREQDQSEYIKDASVEHSKGLAAVDPLYGHVCEAPASMIEQPQGTDLEDLAFEIYEKEQELMREDPEAYAQLQNHSLSKDVKKLIDSAKDTGSQSMSNKKARDSRRASVTASQSNAARASMFENGDEDDEKQYKVDLSYVRALPIYETRLLYFYPDEIRNVCVLRTKNAVKMARQRRRSLEIGADEWQMSQAEAYGYEPSRTLPHDVEIVRFEESDVGAIDFQGLFFHPRKGLLTGVCLFVFGALFVFIDFAPVHEIFASGMIRLVEKPRDFYGVTLTPAPPVVTNATAATNSTMAAGAAEEKQNDDSTQQVGLAPFGLALMGVAVMILWYSAHRYEAAMSLWYEYVVHYDVAKNKSKRMKEKMDEQKKVALRDFKRQIFMVLNYYDNFTQGDRSQGTLFEQLSNFFTKLDSYYAERPRVSEIQPPSDSPQGSSGSDAVAFEEAVSQSQMPSVPKKISTASPSIGSGVGSHADSLRERMLNATTEEQAVIDAA